MLSKSKSKAQAVLKRVRRTETNRPVGDNWVISERNDDVAYIDAERRMARRINFEDGAHIKSKRVQLCGIKRGCVIGQRLRKVRHESWPRLHENSPQLIAHSNFCSGETLRGYNPGFIVEKPVELRVDGNILGEVVAEPATHAPPETNTLTLKGEHLPANFILGRLRGCSRRDRH